jgi:outer membrane protein assembly factor BamB
MQVILWTLFAFSPVVADVRPLWAFVEEPGAAIHSRASIANDGTIYVVDQGSTWPRNATSHVYAVHPNGTKKWKFQTGGLVRSGTIVDQNGTIYTGSDALYALWPDGTQKWKFNTGVDKDPVVGEDGTIYITDGTSLKAVSPNGALKWKLTSPTGFGSGAVIGADGTIYAGDKPNPKSYTPGHLYSVTPAGLVNWKLKVPGVIHWQPALALDGTIYVAFNTLSIIMYPTWEYSGTLFAVDPNGTLKWKYETYAHEGMLPNLFTNTPTVAPDGTVYVGAHNQIDRGVNYLLSIDAHGKEQWRREVPNGMSDLDVGPHGTIYVGSDKLYAIAPDGKSIWDFAPEASGAIATPAVGKDGTVYVGSADRYFYALSASPAPAPPSRRRVSRQCWSCQVWEERGERMQDCVQRDDLKGCWADGTCHSEDQGWKPSPGEPWPKDSRGCNYNSTQGDYCKSVCGPPMSIVTLV